MELWMINILYWNAGIRTEEDRHSIRGENVRQKIIELILENNIDIVILAEYTFDMKLMCDMLKTETGKLWQNSLWMHCVRHKVKWDIKRLS